MKHKPRNKADLYRLQNGWDRERQQEESRRRLEMEAEYYKQFGHGNKKDKNGTM